MKALEISGSGSDSVLHICQRPQPQLGPDDLLIRVNFAGINRADILQRQGFYPPPEGVTDIPGLEVSGYVEAVGVNVKGWVRGQPVCALLAGGGYAEYVVVPAVQCLPLPASLALAEAAALPEASFTVWDNVFERGRLKTGETLLIHGGSSGIGTLAIQIAKALGAVVMVTAGSQDKCQACLSLGADVAINYHTHDFVEEVRRFTHGKGVDVVLDMVGGDYVARSMSVLSFQGRHVSIAFPGGRQVTVDLALLMKQQLILTGSTLRFRPVRDKEILAAMLRKEVWPLIEKGRLKPLIHKIFPFEKVMDAHALMESRQHIGKIVLAVGAEG